MPRFEIALESGESRRRSIFVERSSSSHEREHFRYRGQELTDGAIIWVYGTAWRVRADEDSLWPRFVCTPAEVAVMRPPIAPSSARKSVS